jgi:DNA-binding transcriptional ArsR family regulator
VSRLELLIHPVRIRIVEALAGRPMTTRQLHDVLGDIPIATLYRHVDRLVAGEVVRVISERQVRGGVERTLAIEDGAASLQPGDIQTMADAERAFRSFIGSLLARADRWFSSKKDPADSRLGFRHVPLWLTDSEYDELSSRMTAAIQPEIDNRPGGRRRYVVTVIALPDD